jgi:hypothetical protein
MKRFLLGLLIVWTCVGHEALAQDEFDFQPLIDRHFSADDQARAAEGLAAADYMTEAERKTIANANLARLYPVQFAAFYMDWLKEQDDEEPLEKYEAGDPFYASLHADLLKMKPLAPIFPSKKYWKAAHFWAKYSGKRGLEGHNRPWYPIKYQAEVCDYSPSNDPMEMILDLLVDEKVKSLGHRKILLGKWLLAGASIQPHAQYGWCLVMDFGE